MQYIWCFVSHVAGPCDLDLWPFDLDSVSNQFWLSYDYRLLSYKLLNLITFPLSGSHCACGV